MIWCDVPTDLSRDLDVFPTLASLPDPLLLPDMEAACARVEASVRTGTPILVCSDYDVDGMSGAAVLYRALSALEARVDVFVPDRLVDGYGLNPRTMRRLSESWGGPPLVITVDNGCAAHAGVDATRQLGCDVIVTDHHALPAELPECTAVVHPGRPGTSPEVAGLSGSGVAWMLAYQLLRRRGGAEVRVLARELLELAMLGTIADVVPLTGINRLIVKAGLDGLSRTTHPGLLALLSVSRVPSELLASHVAFQLAPRLNAAGRVGVAREAFDLLVCDDADKAMALAELLDARNLERRELTASAMLETVPGTCVQDGDWRPGIVGVIAGRLAENTALPSIVVGYHDGVGHGSCRAPAGFNMLEALAPCADLLLGYGGHARAAGLKVLPGRVAELRERFDAIVRAADIPGLVLDVHAVVPPREATLELVAQLARLEPCGAGNPAPVLRSGPVRVTESREMRGGHRSFRVQGGAREGEMRAVWWKGSGARDVRGRAEFAYRPRVNEWNGRVSVEMEVVAARTPEE